MAEQSRKQLISEQLKILAAAAQVLRDSYNRVGPLLSSAKTDLDVSEKESCEALTARFARLCDFLFQRVFRTVD